MGGLISVFVRESRWFLADYARTRAGFWVEARAREIAADPAPAELGEAARPGLKDRRGIRVPRSRGTRTDPGSLPGLVGLTVWSAFARSAVAVQAMQRDGLVTVTPMRREASSFFERTDAALTLPRPLRELTDGELGDALRAALGVAAAGRDGAGLPESRP